MDGFWGALLVVVVVAVVVYGGLAVADVLRRRAYERYMNGK